MRTFRSDIILAWFQKPLPRSGLDTGHAEGYGDDPWTQRATEAFRDSLPEVEVFFVATGTAANTLRSPV